MNHRSQKDIGEFYNNNIDTRAKTATKPQGNRPLFLRNDRTTSHSPEPKVTQETARTARKGTLEEREDMSNIEGEDIIQQEKVEAESRKFELLMGDRTPSPSLERKIRTEVNSPIKLATSSGTRPSLFTARRSKPELSAGNEMIAVITPKTENQLENSEHKLGQSKRRYVIRNIKKSYNQEEINRNMQIFEEKLTKLTQENKTNAGQLQIYDSEVPGLHHGHRQTLSWASNTRVNVSPVHTDISNQIKDLLPSSIPTKHAGDTTYGVASDKINTATKSTYDAKHAELSSSQESRQLTKRLVNSLHIKKNSDLHLQLANFSNQLYGIDKKDEPKKFEFISMERSPSLSSPRLGTFYSQDPRTTDRAPTTPLLKLTSYFINNIQIFFFI